MTFRLLYDPLRRPQGTYAKVSTADEKLHLYTVFGETYTDGESTPPQALGLMGQAWKVYDTAGLLCSVDDSGPSPVAFDVDGHALASVRTFAVAYRELPDWTEVADPSSSVSVPDLQGESYTTRQSFDAVGRPTSLTTPDGTVQAFAYDTGGRLLSVSATPDGGATAPVVDTLRYNARGQRASASFGWSGSLGSETAGVLNTTYRYDPETFRLARLKTTRVALGGTLPNPDAGTTLQDLVYAWDAAGNPVSVRDHAQEVIYWRNAVVEPHQSFTYDALHRLVQATGREHASHGGGLNRQTGRPYGPGPLVHRADGNALRGYSQSYTYDPVGNLLSMAHTATHGNWTRSYAYQNKDGSRWNNRLVSTTRAGNTAAYDYDEHGNLTAMPELGAMSWDLFDRLSGITKTAKWERTESTAVADNDGDPDGAYDGDPEVWVDGGHNADPEDLDPAVDHDWFYVYDGGGQRVRKVRARGSSGTLMNEERVYSGSPSS